MPMNSNNLAQQGNLLDFHTHILGYLWYKLVCVVALQLVFVFIIILTTNGFYVRRLRSDEGYLIKSCLKMIKMLSKSSDIV